jgi:DNA-binding Lrp family transcriptional regulator
LIKELGGITLSIPMVNSLRTLIERYVSENAKEIPIKKIARELGMNERAISNILKRLK